MMMFPDIIVAFAYVMYQGIDGADLGASRNGEYWQSKRGNDPFDMRIKNKSSPATFSREFSNNMTID